MATATTSTGLSSRTAAALAYSGWWLTGTIFWALERRDPLVRFHAAQAVVVFGLIAAFIVICSGLALASLSFLPAVFGFLIGLAALAWVAGVLLWGVTMWKVARRRRVENTRRRRVGGAPERVDAVTALEPAWA